MPKKFFVQKATPQFWSDAWQATWQSIYGSTANFQCAVQSFREHPTYRHLIRLLPPGAMVVEGGCGLGLWMQVLKHPGIQTIGLDFTTNILVKLKAFSPALLCAGDVLQMPFMEESFDAYLSFGVVEHFQEGPTLVLKEAFRVLKPGGLLFCSVPYMNLIRVLCSPLDGWRESRLSQDYEFYQYAYRMSELTSYLQAEGFEILEIHPQALHMFFVGSRIFQRLFNIFYRALKGREVVWGSTRPESYPREMPNQSFHPSKSSVLMEKFLKGLSNWEPLCWVLGHQILVIARKPNRVSSERYYHAT